MIILSILVISHNQREQLRRCVESVLSQDLPFEHEIVISDDASSDGTWELAQEYASKFEFIRACQCNSNDCCPTIIAERSGYTRSNAYLNSSGKYFVHIDADDFYRPGTDCLKRQVGLLQAHPECSICMQNDWCWREGDPLEKGGSTHQQHQFATGQIVTADEYFGADLFINNGVMMMRRLNGATPASQFPKWYDDYIITFFYLQHGPIVCLDKNDWIYSQSEESQTNSINFVDRTVLWGLSNSVLSAVLMPGIKQYVYKSFYSVSVLLDVVRLLLAESDISSGIRSFCRQFDKAFIFHCAASSSLTSLERARLLFLREYIKYFIKREKFGSASSRNFLHWLCV